MPNRVSRVSERIQIPLRTTARGRVVFGVGEYVGNNGVEEIPGERGYEVDRRPVGVRYGLNRWCLESTFSRSSSTEQGGIVRLPVKFLGNLNDGEVLVVRIMEVSGAVDGYHSLVGRSRSGGTGGVEWARDVRSTDAPQPTMLTPLRSALSPSFLSCILSSPRLQMLETLTPHLLSRVHQPQSVLMPMCLPLSLGSILTKWIQSNKVWVKGPPPFSSWTPLHALHCNQIPTAKWPGQRSLCTECGRRIEPCQGGSECNTSKECIRFCWCSRCG